MADRSRFEAGRVSDSLCTNFCQSEKPSGGPTPPAAAPSKRLRARPPPARHGLFRSFSPAVAGTVSSCTHSIYTRSDGTSGRGPIRHPPIQPFINQSAKAIRKRPASRATRRRAPRFIHVHVVSPRRYMEPVCTPTLKTYACTRSRYARVLGTRCLRHSPVPCRHLLASYQTYAPQTHTADFVRPLPAALLPHPSQSRRQERHR